MRWMKICKLIEYIKSHLIPDLHTLVIFYKKLQKHQPEAELEAVRNKPGPPPHNKTENFGQTREIIIIFSSTLCTILAQFLK